MILVNISQQKVNTIKLTKFFSRKFSVIYMIDRFSQKVFKNFLLVQGRDRAPLADPFAAGAPGVRQAGGTSVITSLNSQALRLVKALRPEPADF